MFQVKLLQLIDSHITNDLCCHPLNNLHAKDGRKEDGEAFLQ